MTLSIFSLLLFFLSSNLVGLTQTEINEVEKLQKQGIKYTSTGKFDEAIECFQKALKINPNAYGLYDDIGVTYGMKGDMNNAILNFKKSAEMVAYLDPGPIRNLAYAYAHIKDYDNAILYFKKALSASWNNLEFIDQIARMYANKKDYKNAILYWEEFLKIKNVGIIHMNIANTYRQMKDEKNTMKHLKFSCELGFSDACKELKNYSIKQN